jgi:hypothetical protein
VENINPLFKNNKTMPCGLSCQNNIFHGFFAPVKKILGFVINIISWAFFFVKKNLRKNLFFEPVPKLIDCALNAHGANLWFDGTGSFIKKFVTIQSPAGDSEHRRNEGAFSPEMSRLRAKGP